jgi:hypothetical protein
LIEVERVGVSRAGTGERHLHALQFDFHGAGATHQAALAGADIRVTAQVADVLLDQVA